MALKPPPKCKRSACTSTCQHYGEVGGYSVQCEYHNLEDARKRRARAKRRREQLRT